MTFQPRMSNRISGFSVIGGLNRREWNGIVADLWDVECAPAAGGFYVADDPRLFIVLDAKGGGRRNIRLRPAHQAPAEDSRRQVISYIPAGMELWAEMVDVNYVRHLDLHFNAEVLSRRLMEDLDRRKLDMPRLLFSEPRFLALAELIAARMRKSAAVARSLWRRTVGGAVCRCDEACAGACAQAQRAGGMAVAPLD